MWGFLLGHLGFFSLFQKYLFPARKFNNFSNAAKALVGPAHILVIYLHFSDMGKIDLFI